MATEAQTGQIDETKKAIAGSLSLMEGMRIREIPSTDIAYTALSTIFNRPDYFVFEDITNPRIRITGEKILELLGTGQTAFIFKLPTTKTIPETDKLNFGENTNFLTIVFKGDVNNNLTLSQIIIYNQKGRLGSPEHPYSLKIETPREGPLLAPILDSSTHPFREITNNWLKELTHHANTKDYFQPYFLVHNNKGTYFIDGSPVGNWAWSGSKNTFLSDGLSGHMLFLGMHVFSWF